MSNLLDIKQLKAWYTTDKNGAGKTTLMNVICGLHDGFDTSGISFKGKEISFKDKDFIKSRYIVFSEDESFGYFNFDEYIAYVFKCYEKSLDKEYINQLVTSFGFEEYRSVLIKNLSLGNRRKAYLITGFALKPDLLLLDEPVNGLDFVSTETL